MFVADTLRIRYKVQEDTNNHRPRMDPWAAKNVLITTPIRSCHAQYRRARPVSTFLRGWCRFSYVGRHASRRLNLIILVSSSVRGSASFYHVSYPSGRCVSNSSEKARYLASYLAYVRLPDKWTTVITGVWAHIGSSGCVCVCVCACVRVCVRVRGGYSLA
jgi:hypothetical protein